MSSRIRLPALRDRALAAAPAYARIAPAHRHALTWPVAPVTLFFCLALGRVQLIPTGFGSIGRPKGTTRRAARTHAKDTYIALPQEGRDSERKNALKAVSARPSKQTTLRHELARRHDRCA